MSDPFLEVHGDLVAGLLVDRLRRSALIGSLCVPSPSAMNELRNGWPSTVPATFTSPRVPKYSAEPGITT